ncbi:alpha/beta hydrolase [Candidatus Kaiserbacteria bacterium]|nr:alpha/beta hydrolase [Candidatus Kaiserbacteria bacterium]
MKGLSEKPRQPSPENIDPSLLKELTEKRPQFLELVKDAKTFQQLIWDAEIAGLGQETRAKVLGDDGSTVSVDRIVQELINIDIGEEQEDPGNQRSLRQIRALFQKVVELRSQRAEFNTLYREERVVRTTPAEDEFFAIHAIDRGAFNKEKNLDAPEEKTPIMIALGYSTGDIAARRNAVGLAELGRSVATFDLPPKNTYFDPTLNYPPNTADFTKVHVTALLKSLEECNKNVFDNPDGKYDVLAYSVGGINTVIAAMIRPEKFRKILLVNSAGLTNRNDPYWKRFKKLAQSAVAHRKQVLSEAGKTPQKMSFFERMALLYDFAWNDTEEEDAEKVYDYNRLADLHTEFSAEMEAISKKGGWKMPFQVADAISRIDLVPMIKYLKEEHGIEIGMLPGEGDPLFDVSQIEEAGKDAGVDVFPAVGAHANLGFNPAGMTELYVDFLAHMGEAQDTDEKN